MAFHPYPQVIAAVFNRRAFGPPRGLTPASACPRIAHPASRPRRGTQVALLRLAFASAPFRLTSPRASDSLAHSTKGTPSHRKGAPTARGRAVSGAVSLPSRGAFHLSLTVLVRYRSWESAQPWRVVPPASDRVSRARPYSGSAFRGGRGFAYGALTLCGRPSHAVPLPRPFVTAAGAQGPRAGRPTTPAGQRPWRFAAPAGLGWCAFARRYSRNLG